MQRRGRADIAGIRKRPCDERKLSSEQHETWSAATGNHRATELGHPNHSVIRNVLSPVGSPNSH
jgi:hypothetical protein